MGLYVLESRLEQHGLASYKGSLCVCVKDLITGLYKQVSWKEKK